MTYERRNKGTCSVMTKVELNPDHTIESVEVLGGCNGNLKGICQLLKGMKAENAIERMKGTRAAVEAELNMPALARSYYGS